MSQQATIDDFTYGGEFQEPECPPEQEYVLQLIEVEGPVMGQSFDGKAPEPNLILHLKINAENPAPDSLQAEWHDFDLREYATPKLHYYVNLPDYSGQGYRAPKLYIIAKALNGGVPLELPTAISETRGKHYYLPYGPHEAAEMMRELVGRRFRCVVGPNNSGWPRLKGDAMPLLTPGTGRRRTQAATPAAAPTGGDPFEPDDDI